MARHYEQGFRDNLVRRMCGPNAISARALAAETGVGQPTLSRWKASAFNLSVMNTPPDPTTPGKSTRDWTAMEKLAVVGEAAGLAPEQLGAFLRTKGLRTAELDAWRAQFLSAVGDGKSARRRAEADARRIKELERELRGKDRRLKVTEALLELQKKVGLMLGDADESTPSRSEP